MTDKFLFTLTNTEVRRLIAYGVSQLPIIQRALQHGTIIVANGITNAFIVEELSSQIIEDKSTYTAGIVVDGVACITSGKTRRPSIVLEDGEIVDKPWLEVLKTMSAQDVFIKGANAIDLDGHAGVLLGGTGGGTIGKALGYLATSGTKLLVPAGLDKLIPSVTEAAEKMGKSHLTYSIGTPCGLLDVTIGDIFTELDALETCFEVEATQVSAGGIGDCAGASIILVEGYAEDVRKCYEFIKELKKGKTVVAHKRPCSECPNTCDRF